MELEKIRTNLFAVHDHSYGGFEGNGGMIRRPDGGIFGPIVSSRY